MAEPKTDNPPDVIRETPAAQTPDTTDGDSATASPASSPTEGKSDNYFSRKFGSMLNRSLRKFKKTGSQDKLESEHQNGHEDGENSPPSKSPEKSPRSPRTPKTPDGARQGKFQRMFRSSKKSKSVEYIENEAASTANILGGDKPDKPEPLKERHAPVTKYGLQKEIVVDGKALKEIEVTGEKQQETFPEARRSRRISRSRRKAEFEGDELKVQCRDLAPADYEGWLFKKSGGTTLSPVVWKQCWVVLKNGILYLYKTSFDIAAQHAYSVRNFSVAPVEEKRKFTFKLVPKNVPPEALQDAKGVVFACESDADVEKWCDVLNKAALGFIIQPSPRPEKVEPIRRRCQSSAVRKDKHKLTHGDLNHTGHRTRSSTFTGETTGLPATFNKTGSGSRVRKTSQSGSSSVLAVGNMFLAIDEPPSRTTKGSNSDLTSIVYKEQLVSKNNANNIAEQSQAAAGPGEDEVRMEVKKEIERINKHSTKQPKPVEGGGPTVACTQRADIIRQEILDLKEESQRLNDKGSESETGNGSEEHQGDKDVDEAGKEKETEIENQVRDGEFISKGEDIDLKDVKVDERGITNETVNHDVKTNDEMPINDKQLEVDAQESDECFEAEEEPTEGDSGIAIEEYLNLIDASEAETGIEEYIARMTETSDNTVEEYLAMLESTAEKDESCVGSTDEVVAAELQHLLHKEESRAVKGPPVATKPSREVEENRVGSTDDATSVEEHDLISKKESGATEGPPVAAKPSREVEENRVGSTDDATSVEQHDLISKKESGATEGPPVAAKPSREMDENCLGITDEVTVEEPRFTMTNERNGTSNGPPIAAKPSAKMEESFVEIDDEATAESIVDENIAEESQDPNTKEAKETDGPPIAAKPSPESQMQNDKGEKDVQGGEETPLTPSGMIPTKHQRMLIDTVLSLDYPSDSESETDNGEEICHYAQIERPSTPGGVLDQDCKQTERKDQDDIDEEFDIIICAPPEFCDKDSKHQSLTRIRDHAVLYGATEEGKSIVHHTFIKNHESDKEAGVGASDGVDNQEGGTALEGEDPSQGKAAAEGGVESIREQDGPEVVTMSDNESDSGTDEVIDSNLPIDETRDEVLQPEPVVEPAGYGTTELQEEMQLKTSHEFTSTYLPSKLDSIDADQNINSQTTESSLEDICPEKRPEIVNMTPSIQAADVCDDNLLEADADSLEKDADSVVKDTDTCEKDADSVKNGADSIARDADTFEKDTDSGERDSASHSFKNEIDPPETNAKFLAKDDDTSNTEIMAIVSGSKDVDGGNTEVENVHAADGDEETQNSRTAEGKSEEEAIPTEQTSRENEAETGTGKAVSTEGDTRSITETRGEDICRNEDKADPNNNNTNNNSKADGEELSSRSISPTATTTTIKIVNVKVSVRKPSEDFEDSHEHAEETYPLESSV